MAQGSMIDVASGQLKGLLQGILKDMIQAGELPDREIPTIAVEIPADPSHGNFATNVALAGAKAFSMAPRKLAEGILARLTPLLENSYFEKAETAGPGFINCFFRQSWYENTLKRINNEGGAFGRTVVENPKSVLVEFVSANPTGPMHVGNARGGAIGDTLASILDWAGYRVEREFYVNDAGNQIVKLGISLEARYMQIFQPDFPLPEESYHGQDIVEHALAFKEIHGDKYLNADSEERQKALVDFALPKNIAGLERDLESYRIVYDNWFRESTLHKDGSVEKILEQLKSKGATYELDGALWFKATEFGAEQDFVLVRSNGIPTYIVPDILYHYNKLVTRGFDRAIDLLGADHHGYVPRLKAALTALGVDSERLEAIIIQMVRLVRGTEVIKLSKRSGKAITLVTLLEEVPVDAARFFFNLREPNSHCDFDLDLAVEQSSQNPVYYVQYAHARICSILRQIAEEGGCVDLDENLNYSPATMEEVEIIQLLARFTNIISESAAKNDPSLVTKYAMDLAAKFHKFYAACRVKDAPQELFAGRIGIALGVKTVLENASSILKIHCPDSM